jgi:hypothetical protein
MLRGTAFAEINSKPLISQGIGVLAGVPRRLERTGFRRCPIHDEQTRATRNPRKMHRRQSSFGNKRVVARQSGSTVIAIFVEHSTPFESRTIIFQ